MHTPVIAIDGPAGSGKSSVSRRVATQLGLRYLDTGAMYRAMTWAMLQSGVDVNDAAAVAAQAPAVSVSSGTDPQAPTIRVNGIDVAGPIRGEAVTAAVSAVSAVPSLRERLVGIQRDTVASARAAGTGIVVEGRDITTVVLPDADVKVYLTADPQVRARRRAKQDERTGATVDLSQTQTALVARDAKDASRQTSPLAVASDAVVIDTTDMSLDEVVARIVELSDAVTE